MKVALYQFRLFLFLETILFARSDVEFETYYVKPINGSCGEHYPCHPLDYYYDNLSIDNYVPGKGYNLIFIRGVHVSTTNTSGDEFMIPHFVSADYIKFEGNDSADEVIVKTAYIKFFDTETVLIENLTVNSSILELTPQRKLYLSNNITLSSCIFINTSLQMDSVNLFVNNTDFLSSPSTAISLYSSTISLSGNVNFKCNKGIKGGALALIGTKLIVNKDTAVLFENNTADEVGGALYIDIPKSSVFALLHNCFYQLLNLNLTDKMAYYNMTFSGNSAVQSGDHVYGAGIKTLCIAGYQNNTYEILNIKADLWYHFNVQINPNSSISAISGEPSRACICDSIGQPQCADISKIFVTGWKVFPGQTFTLPAVVVGGDLGTTTGNVYTKVYSRSDGRKLDEIIVSPQVQAINTHRCANTTYSLLSNDAIDVPVLVKFHLTTEEIDIIHVLYNYEEIQKHCHEYTKKGFLDPYFLDIPIFVSVTVLPCPPGFFFAQGSSRCECYPLLIRSEATCELDNERGIGLITWDTGMWISFGDSEKDNTTDSKLSISTNCPANLCKVGKKTITYLDQDAQCSENRIGRLCGGCKHNYSLAIGSFNCIHCSNNDNLSLLIFFVAAGPLLIVLISVLNLTVTQGMINGLVVYANIIWAYQSFFFPHRITGILTFLQVFIAWLNFDFRIETCFVIGLDAYWKTWLQYTFPIYTAGLFVIGVRYSSKLSNLCGSRSVPTLATLLFLSYTKLLHTVIASLRLASVAHYSENDTKIRTVFVWALDGRLTYGTSPHIFLLLAAIACLTFLWIPYTVLLFFMQWLRRVDHHQPLRLIAKYKPVYDAYFAPLKDKHHYWFGVLLSAQGTLLVVSSLTLNIFPSFSIFMLLFVVILMLWYMNYKCVYKTKSVTILESSFFVNLALLTCGTMYYKGNDYVSGIIIQISIGFAFLKFLIIVTWNVILTFRQSSCHRYVVRHGYKNLQEVEELPPDQHHQPPVDFENSHYRDSIFDEDYPIVKTDEATY